MKIHYFQRYHGKENVHTSNTMLLLSRLYQFSTAKFYRFLAALLPDNADIELSFTIQDAAGGGTVPDATIAQASFKIAVETKLSGSFRMEQLAGHLRAFGNEDYKVLLTLDPRPMRATQKEALDALLAAHNAAGGYVIHRHLTFEDIISQINEVIDDRDYEFQDILEDYREYCSDSRLLLSGWKRMRVRLASDSLAINLRYNLYYNKPGGYTEHDYLGLYDKKSVRAIGKIYAVAAGWMENGTLVMEAEKGELTEDMRDRVRMAITEAQAIGHPVHTTKELYFFVEKFYETDFTKSTKGALMGAKFFDLCQLLGAETLPDTAEIAKRLHGASWA